MKPHIDEHDYKIKIKQAIGFLNKKDKVKINLFFRGREMSFRDQGEKIIARAIVDLSEAGQVEKAPMMEGRVLSVLVSPRAQQK